MACFGFKTLVSTLVQDVSQAIAEKFVMANCYEIKAFFFASFMCQTQKNLPYFFAQRQVIRF
ncbi:hypothetical protein, partial [Fischerella thermalis]|uniref:hypothetical protein n=1 Tax=Fischerella thermalis TaxID=372787 RepID=UPI00242EC48A